MRKSGKNPSLEEKKIITSAGLNYKNWLVQKKDNENIYIIHRESRNVRKIPKRRREK